MSQSFQLPAFMGHRGAMALAPENTLPAMDAAARAGCTWVEVDVMLSRDGVPVLHHDHALRRTAGDRRKVEAVSAAELARVDVGRRFGPGFAGVTVPSLAEALGRMAELGLMANLEIKPALGAAQRTTEAVIEVVEACWPADRPPPLLSSFRRKCLKVARRRRGDWPRALLVDHVPEDWHRRLEALQCVALHASRRHLTEHRAAAVRHAGFALAVYTVNDTVTAQGLRRWGVDCIITDRPDLLRPVLSRPLPPVGVPPAGSMRGAT